MFGLVEMAGEAGSGKCSASLSLRARAKRVDFSAQHIIIASSEVNNFHAPLVWDRNFTISPPALRLEDHTPWLPTLNRPLTAFHPFLADDQAGLSAVRVFDRKSFALGTQTRIPQSPENLHWGRRSTYRKSPTVCNVRLGAETTFAKMLAPWLSAWPKVFTPTHVSWS